MYRVKQIFWRLFSEWILKPSKLVMNCTLLLLRLLTLIHLIQIESVHLERCLRYGGCLQSDPFEGGFGRFWGLWLPFNV